MIARQVFYEGRVQGVGFRYTVHQIATGFEISGWVRNLPDGRVELLAAGVPGEVAEFIDAIHESQLGSFIKSVTASEIPVPAGIHGFEITQ